MPEAPSRRGGRPVFRPRFTLTLLYLAFFFLLFGMLFALPDLLEGARNLEPGPEELTPEDLARARDTAREALAGGRLLVALALATIATGLGGYARVLPGLRGD
jgi:hypothetical protein